MRIEVQPDTMTRKMRQTIFGDFRFKLRICADIERYIISVSVVAMKNDSTKLNLADFILKPTNQRYGEVKKEKNKRENALKALVH